jgi:methyl-accepting chemotaxis protein
VTQQNASASEEMASTSEELAAQSEELQTSISYFRVESSRENNKATAVRKTTAAARPVAKPAAKRNSLGVAEQQARLRGFALDMNHGGPDSADEEFRAAG